VARSTIVYNVCAVVVVNDLVAKNLQLQLGMTMDTFTLKIESQPVRCL